MFLVVVCLFLFKQKTAYEVRISDWSSDVCSSDVAVIAPGFAADCLETLEELAIRGRDGFLAAGGERFAYLPCLNAGVAGVRMLKILLSGELAGRSEEHTSELQSLMRISYAVFCLTKKKPTKHHNEQRQS